MGLSSGVMGQCATLAPGYDPIVADPPANAGCQGGVYIRYCSTVTAARITNTATGQVVWYNQMNGCGGPFAGCPGGCLYGQYNLSPGDYTIEPISGGEPCASYSFNVPAVGPQHHMTLAIADGSQLPTGPCAGSGVLDVAYSLPTPNCLPAPTARLYLGDSPTGDHITGVLTGGVFRFQGVPAMNNYYVTAGAGPLTAELPIAQELAPCPSLGGTPQTQDATSQTPGRISGTVPQIGCNVAVAVVSVATGQSVTVVEQGTNWYAVVPAGQYAVAIGAGTDAACLEEYVVEVGQAAVPCDGTVTHNIQSFQTAFGQADATVAFIISGAPPEQDWSITVTDPAAQFTATRSGVTGIGLLLSGLYPGSFTGTYTIVGTDCSGDLGTIVVPCLNSMRLYKNTDNDGDGDPDVFIDSCMPAAGYFLDTDGPTDCDDNNPDINQGVRAREDQDDDGFWVGEEQLICGPLPDGWYSIGILEGGPDCDDQDPLHYELIGTSCTPATQDPCRTNYVIQQGCVCQGTPKPDTDGDGVCDLIDTCPGVLGPMGGSCNDENDATSGDENVIGPGGVCICAGTCPGGFLVGAACNDGVLCTINDRIKADCSCAGDDDDTDGDNICDGLDGCRGTSGNIGSTCDDHDPATVNDKLVAVGTEGTSCDCVGTPCAPEVTLSLSITTDNHGDQVSWSVMDYANNEVVCSGSDLPNNTTTTKGCCVEQGHCYKVTVTDSGGDGIVRGGYVVRMGGADGIRLIDNTNNFRAGGSSAISGIERMCWSMGNVSIVEEDCDLLNWVKLRHVRCTADPNVSAAWVPNAPNSAQSATTGYEFWFFDPNGSFNEVYFRNHQRVVRRMPAGPLRATHFVINDWDPATVPHLPGNRLLNVRVRAKVNNVAGPWGPACKFKFDPSREDCPITELITEPGNGQHSCNVQRTTAPNQRLYATPVHYDIQNFLQARDDKYHFRFRNAEGEPAYEEFASVYRNYVILGRDLAGAALQQDRTYLVDVRVSLDGGTTWCVGDLDVTGDFEAWGEVCTVTMVASSGMAPMYDPATGEGVDVILYPDPVTEDQLFIHTTGLPPHVERVDVDIHSITGERVRSEQLPAEAGTLHTRLDLHASMAPGVYLVVLHAEGERWTRRVVIQ